MFAPPHSIVSLDRNEEMYVIRYLLCWSSHFRYCIYAPTSFSFVFLMLIWATVIIGHDKPEHAACCPCPQPCTDSNYEGANLSFHLSGGGWVGGCISSLLHRSSHIVNHTDQAGRRRAADHLRGIRPAALLFARQYPIRTHNSMVRSLPYYVFSVHVVLSVVWHASRPDLAHLLFVYPFFVGPPVG